MGSAPCTTPGRINEVLTLFPTSYASKNAFRTLVRPPIGHIVVHQRFLMELCCHDPNGTELHQNDEAYGAVRKLVSSRQVAPMVPPPANQGTAYLSSKTLHTPKCITTPHTDPPRPCPCSAHNPWRSRINITLVTSSHAKTTKFIVLQKTMLVNNGQCLWHCPNYTGKSLTYYSTPYALCGA